MGRKNRRCAFQRGWTRKVRGGLGGTVIPVTTLKRSGRGSLSWALKTPGPRVIVFEVGGVIDLETQRLNIEEPYVTIAGQTAPSPGITLIRGSLRITTHDVVVQHLRVRPGEADQDQGWEPDGISTYAARNVIIDHCSITWAIDENLSASGPRFDGKTPKQWRKNTSNRITFSRNIVAEALSHSTHSSGEHSKGTLIHDNASKILIYGNLYASNVDRNPMFKGGTRGAIVNNYIVNPEDFAVSFKFSRDDWGSRPPQTGKLSIVGNVFRHGPDTDDDGRFMRVVEGPLELYLEDNLAEDIDGNPVKLLTGDLSDVIEKKLPPAWPKGLKALPSKKVLRKLEKDVGARPWDRDEVDKRIIRQALRKLGSHIDHEDEVGGYPEHNRTSAPFCPTQWDKCFKRIG